MRFLDLNLHNSVTNNFVLSKLVFFAKGFKASITDALPSIFAYRMCMTLYMHTRVILHVFALFPVHRSVRRSPYPSGASTVYLLFARKRRAFESHGEHRNFSMKSPKTSRTKSALITRILLCLLSGWCNLYILSSWTIVVDSLATAFESPQKFRRTYVKSRVCRSSDFNPGIFFFYFLNIISLSLSLLQLLSLFLLLFFCFCFLQSVCENILRNLFTFSTLFS